MPDRDLSGEARLRGEREVRRRSRGQTVQRVREQAQTRRKSTDLREKHLYKVLMIVNIEQF